MLRRNIAENQLQPLPWQRSRRQLPCKQITKTDSKTKGLSAADRIFIRNLHFAKDYGAVRLINESPATVWKKSMLNDFVKHLKQNKLDW